MGNGIFTTDTRQWPAGSDKKERVIVGLGKTGLSCARYLHRRGLPFKIIDTRVNPPGEAECRQQFADVPLHTGGFNESWLMAADELVVSPGIALAEPAIASAIANGAKAIGDIELFCRALNESTADKPLVAITGSNGKSTVTTLVGDMVCAAGLKPGVGGNIGTPALDLLDDPDIDVYVLELSSFQLETTFSLRATAATVLNISPDHMDRYTTLDDYKQAKQRIYHGCETAIVNRDDPMTLPVQAERVVSFGSDRSGQDQFGLLADSEGVWLSKGPDKLLDSARLKIKGRHNHLNALAALALGEAIGLDMTAMLRALCDFSGLPHRCQWLAESAGVSWFNDSKATNVGAAIAAIDGLGAGLTGKVIVIAGGDGKGADFSDLRPAVTRYVSHLVLLGRDGPAMAQVLAGSAVIHECAGLEEAVSLAARLAQPGDAVLLAPACASLDMFNSFEHRGERFAELVNGLIVC